MAGCARRAKNGAIPTRSRMRAEVATCRSARTPRASSTSMLPARLVAARLPCLATGTPAPATTKAAAVEMLKEPTPSPPVPQVSTVRGSTHGARTARARKARATATISPGVSPFVRSATSSAAIATGDALPSIISPNAASRTPGGTSSPWIARSSAARRLMPRPPRNARGNSQADVCPRESGSIRDETARPRGGARGGVPP